MKDADDMNERELLFNAMEAAKVVFDKFFEDNGYEGAYFTLDLIGYKLSVDFEPLYEMKMTDYYSGSRIIEGWKTK